MSTATGYCARKDGVLQIRSLMDTVRGVHVNWLIMHGFFVPDSATDEAIKQAFDQFTEGAIDVVLVTITEALQ